MNTLTDLRILTARRGYEFALDDLRLTMLSTDPVIRQLATAFEFKAAAVTSPPPTFGPVHATLPAGVVFQVGMWVVPETSQVVPIRFLNIEPQRIVIDIAGPSTSLDGIFAKIREETSPITSPDGSPILGEPSRVLHFSEISFSTENPLVKLFVPGFAALLSQKLPVAGRDEATALAPTIHVRALPHLAAYSGEVAPGDGFTFSLSLRAGTTPEQQILYSSAPLETEQHIQLVSDAMALLS